MCLEAGLTGVHDAGVSRREAEVYRDARPRRPAQAPGLRRWPRPPRAARSSSSSQPVPQAGPGARFEMRAIKLFIDGAMGSRGGLLFEPYSDDPGNSRPAPDRPQGARGDDDRGPASTAGRSPPTPSATGATPWCSTPTPPPARPSPRRATPGCGSSTPRSSARRTSPGSPSSGVIASMQPSHASDDMRWADARLGPGRVDGAYAWRWFLDAASRWPSAATSPSRSSTRSRASTPP